MSEWTQTQLNHLVTIQKGRKVEMSEHPQPGYARNLGASGIQGKFDGYASTQNAVVATDSDILMLWDGERSGLVGHGQVGVVASTVCRLTPVPSIHSQYLYFALAHQFDWIQNRRTGSGVPHVAKEIGRILVVRHPKARASQARIAAILTSLDAAIEKTEVLIEKHQQIKAGLMHDLFTRGVLPNGQLRPRNASVGTRFGLMPSDWRLGSILELTDAARQPILTGPFGADLGSADFVAEGVPVLRIGNVQQGRLDLSDLLYVSTRKAATLSRYRVKEGDLLFARQGATTGRNALADHRVEGSLINYHIIRVALDQKHCSPLFVEAAFSNEIVKRQVERDKGRGTREGINTAQLTSLAFPLAPVIEQRRIAEVLAKHIQVLRSAQDELESLSMQKIGLMQDLLTGKVPVNATEHGAPA